jgi:RNA polymerase sigma factor (sigma-70 family)
MNRTGETAGDAARKRLAVEMVARHEAALQRTAQRFSLCAEDAEDAFQRSLEILLVKAPPGEARELVRWMHTVIKHEALAIRRTRERQLGAPPPSIPVGEDGDWVALIPAPTAGPEERAERREAIARSREALKTLKPAELRALTLLAEGFSYAEIGELTGFSATKINRCLAEGRERFRRFLSRSEDGTRCAELRPLLSAYCDGEAAPDAASAVHEHLRACAHCRAAMRAYRAAPRAAAALAPIPIASPSLLDRFHEAIAAVQTRLPGQGAAADSAMAQVAAAGGTRGAGMAALAKVLAVCVGTAGGAAACVTAGVVPAPLDLASDHSAGPAIERKAEPGPEAPPSEPPAEEVEAPSPAPEPHPEKQDEHKAASESEAAPVEAAATEAGAVEYTPPPAPAPASAGSAGSGAASSGSAAGEFGP